MSLNVMPYCAFEGVEVPKFRPSYVFEGVVVPKFGPVHQSGGAHELM